MLAVTSLLTRDLTSRAPKGMRASGESPRYRATVNDPDCAIKRAEMYGPPLSQGPLGHIA